MPSGSMWRVKPWGEAATASVSVVRGSRVSVGGDVVVAVEVGAAEEVDDVEAEVVAGAGVAAGELLVVFGGVLAVQGHGAGFVEDLVDVDEVDVVLAGPGEHVAVRGVGVGGSRGRRGGGVGGAEGGAVDVGPEGEVVVRVGGGGLGEAGADGGVGRDGAAEPDAVDDVGDGGRGGQCRGAGGLFPAALAGRAVVGGDGAGVGGQGGGAQVGWVRAGAGSC